MRRYRLLLLALLLVGTLLSSFHHHDNGNVDENCFVCIVQSVFSAADVPDIFSLEAITLFFLIPLLHKSVYISAPFMRSYSSRAPPSFS